MEKNQELIIKEVFWNAEYRIRNLQRGDFDDILGVVGSSFEEKMKKRKDAITAKKEEIVKKLHLGKRGNPIAISPITYKGKPCYYTKLNGKPIYRESREAIIDYLYKYYGGDALSESHSVAYYFECYMADYVTNNPEKAKTVRNTAGDYARFINPELASMDVREITPKYLTAYSKALVTRLKLRPSAFKNFKTLLNYIFDMAIECQIITDNPAKGVNNKACFALCDQSIVSSFDYDEKLISEEEYAAVEAEAQRRLQYSKRYGEQYLYLYDLMLGLHHEIGGRPGELCSLKWQDISFSGDLHIHSEIDSNGSYQDYTKNERGESKGGRYFPLTPKAKAILAEIRTRQEKVGVISDFIFCYKDGRFILPTSYEEYLHNVFDKVGLAKTSYTFRRTVNNRLEEEGFTPSERALLLGHSPETNVKHYTNPHKNATLEKFRKTFCTENTKIIPNNVIDFKSKKPKNREFSGFSKTTITAGSRT